MKINKGTLFIVFVTMSFVAGARNVDPLLAKALAQSMLSAKGVKAELHNATPASWVGKMLLYTTDKRGFVLMPADDAVRPILAYSTDAAFPTDNIPPHVQVIIQQYADIVEYAKRNDLQQHPSWKRLLYGTASKDGDGVGPLVTAHWGQMQPFNLLCPSDPYWTPPSRCLTGCVATAMAQIMYYWHWPNQGWGQFVYDSYTIDGNFIATLSEQFDTVHYQWSLMLDEYDNSSTEAERYAVARLMYDCGVAVGMYYSVDASGANPWNDIVPSSPSAGQALRTYFRYHPMLQGISRFNYVDSEWMELVLAELDAGRPMLYSASTESFSHAFVLDGYDADRLMHFNFGWYGNYDGFYALDSICPTATISFNFAQLAVIGIRPNTEECDPAIIRVVADDTLVGYCAGGGEYAYADSVSLLAHAIEGYRFNGWVSGSYENPYYIPATTSLTDTARICQLSIDTLYYCTPIEKFSWSDLNTWGITRWGIRIPTGSLHGERGIYAVQYFRRGSQEETMRLKIYRGSTPDESGLVYQCIYEIPEGNAGWINLDINTPVFIDTTSDLWVTFEINSGEFFNWQRYCHSTYGGNSDGCWFYNQTGWHTLDNAGVWGTWMIRALTRPVDNPIAIEIVAGPEMEVSAIGSTIQVSLSSEVPSLSLYDETGRCLQTFCHCRQATFTTPASGIYFVYPQGGTAQRVVIVTH